ncbi:crAss001_48 related protein [Megasphaera elsdenii]|uniref:crAss001_48 related protein n=1 Tax=Megasphaera elsdenii TaxID=907 RepID=UPI0009234FB4|nr:hypothetical protein [Megasphaera elsdenii]SHK44735.1 hypothetical protein SAMN04488492_11339 [Megasphaera elsdenii]
MKDYIYRMMDERKDLATKAYALANFLSNTPIVLNDTEKYLMHEQLEIMNRYIDILDARIDNALLKEQKEDEK